MTGNATTDLDWAKTAPVPPTLPALLRWGANICGARDLLVIDDTRVSYAQIDGRSVDFAAQLLQSGVGRGDRVGLLVPGWRGLSRDLLRARANRCRRGPGQHPVESRRTDAHLPQRRLCALSPPMPIWAPTSLIGSDR